MRPVARALVLAAAVTAVACFELSGPNDGVVSITGIRAASPAVAVGDVMRDENAQPAPLTIIALDANGDTVRDVQPTFVVLDEGATVDAAGLVTGEEVRPGPVRIVGSVGGLQSPLLSLRVVEPPDSVKDTVGRAADTVDARYPAGVVKDTVLQPVGLRVLNGAEGVPSWPVRFSMTTSVISASASNPAVRLVKRGSETRATIDTTDASGYGLLGVHVVPIAMTEASRARVETVTITASTVRYVAGKAERYARTYVLKIRAQAP
jgi:hypothetical protein